MIFRLIVILFLYVNTAAAMITPQQLNEQFQTNFREIMPEKLKRCVKLMCDEDFNDSEKKFKEYLSEDPELKNADIKVDLSDLYFSTKDRFIKKRDLLAPQFPLKDYIYEELLGYFWWNHLHASF